MEIRRRGPGGSRRLCLEMNPMGALDLRSALRAALERPLPGEAAHARAWPAPLPSHLEDPAAEDYHPAAVLIALCPLRPEIASSPDPFLPPPAVDRSLEPAALWIPLIRRPGRMRQHAGQISLPGGECGPGEPIETCALRETFEEVALPPERVEVLGTLTSIPVSVSRYRIHPVVGWVRERVRFTPQEEEVDEVLLADPDRLLARGLDRVVERERGGWTLRAPAYRVDDFSGREHLVWGATAIILAEFLEIWGEARNT